MIFIDELKENFLYKKPFHLPIMNEKDRKHHSSVIILSPSLEASMYTINHPLSINNKYFESYYIEKDISYYVNDGGILTEAVSTGNKPPVLSQPKTAKPANTGAGSNIGSAATLRSLNMRIKKPKYKVNKQGDSSRNAIGTNDDTISKKSNNTEEETVAELSRLYFDKLDSDYESNDAYLRFINDSGVETFILFDHDIVLEDKKYNSVIKKIIYDERYKNNSEIFSIYEYLKKNTNNSIKYTFINLEKYKQKNVFIDLYKYLDLFNRNNIYKLDKGIELYADFLNRLINDSRILKAGYLKRTVFVPVKYWAQSLDDDKDLFDFRQSINPISMIYRAAKFNPSILNLFKDTEFIFLGDKGYFKCNISNLSNKNLMIFTRNINKLLAQIEIPDDNPMKETSKSIKTNIISKIEDEGKIKVYGVTGGSKTTTEEELQRKLQQKQDLEVCIDKIADSSTNTKDAIEKMNDDEVVKDLLDMMMSEESEVKISPTRSKRIKKLQDDFRKTKIKDKTIDDILNNKVDKIEETSLSIDTINDEWEHLTYTNFEKSYDVDQDILMILDSLSEKTYPLSIVSIDVQNTSTSEDYKETYIVKLEDINGDRFTIKFDVPKLKDDKFMMLRGNDKTINGQLTLIPIIKTDRDTVQIVSNYKKIFIRRFGSTFGKSLVATDIFIKVVEKLNYKISYGNNSKVCNKYELPMDYIDLASGYNYVECKNYILYFNQDTIRETYKIDESKGIPIGYNKNTKEIIYYNERNEYVTLTNRLLNLIRSENEEDWNNIIKGIKPSTRYTYSQASILNTKIPLIVVMGYSEGLIKSLDKAKIHYNIVDKLDKGEFNTEYNGFIKFKDGYLVFESTYEASLLLNGLRLCNTEDFSIREINSKRMWLDFIELFGSRIISDGLDNFYDLMIDPITKEVLEYYKLPTDYIEVLGYANALLADNGYIKHTDMSGRRYRSNELIAGYVYQSIAEAYGDYKTEFKRRGKGTMTMKQTVVLDKILQDPTCSDLSILNDLLTVESSNTVGYKGLAGMNSDRSYGLDKRVYDDSMINVLGLSTGFAGNVGVTRQATMDMNIEGKRGYIKTNSTAKDMNISKTFTATEALTPYGTTRDSAFRSAMTFIQTSKHGMRIKNGTPLLVSNGADQALPYLSSNTFSYKSKDNGKVVEKTDDYMILEYKDGSHDFVDLRDSVKKNSNGGFFVSVKLDTDLKEGNTIKKGQIVAYDKLSYSDKVGGFKDNNISYNLGNLAKIAILQTDEGFEDSAIISEYLSDAMSSEVVLKKEISLEKNTNIYQMVKKGQPIQEGDPLIVFQHAFDDEDSNALVKALASDDPDLVSDLGRIPVKSKVTGVVQDIKISYTCKKEEMSDSLKKIVNTYEKPIKGLNNVCKKYDIDSSNIIESTDTLEETGKLKNVHDGVLIEFYLKYNDKLSVGDKVVYYSALKGTVKEVFQEGSEPYTDRYPDEKIQALLSQGSVVGRMVCSILVTGGINKGLIELDRKIKKMAGIPYKNLDEM